MRHATAFVCLVFASVSAIASLDTTLPRKPHDLSGIWAAHGVWIVPGDDERRWQQETLTFVAPLPKAKG